MAESTAARLAAMKAKLPIPVADEGAVFVQPAPAPAASPVKTEGVRLWSPGGNMPDGSTHISLTSGHTLIVPHDREGCAVPKIFRREAIARGCLPVGMEEDAPEASGPDRQDIIRAGIDKMMSDDAPGLFTSDGRPALPALSKLCGFSLTRSEVNRVWDDVNKVPVETISNVGAKA